MVAESLETSHDYPHIQWYSRRTESSEAIIAKRYTAGSARETHQAESEGV